MILYSELIEVNICFEMFNIHDSAHGIERINC